MNNQIGNSLMIVGFIGFLVGYFFLGLVQGQNSCTNVQELKTMQYYKGGMAGVLLGLIFLFTGYIVRAGEPRY